MEGDHRREENWTEEVEDLVNGGEIDKAITVLESVLSKLDGSSRPQFSQLATALLDLSKFYSSQGLSLKADDARSRAIRMSQQESQSDELLRKRELIVVKESASGASNNSNQIIDDDSQEHQKDFSSLQKDESIQEEVTDDDWEAVADRSPDELLTPISLPGVSKLSLEDVEVKSTKRRGRGTFSYKKAGMYSDEQLNEPVIGDDDEVTDFASPAGDGKTKNLIYGTKHVLVLSGFPLSTRTIDLEKLFERFKDRGVVIRWVNDTTALAVFKSPSTALDASMCIKCPFEVRVLDEMDEILSSIPPRDLEPPVVRPKTSARTAQRLIAQSMGIKLDSTSFGSEELRKQEAARKNRIVSRQNLKDDAWGDDAN